MMMDAEILENYRKAGRILAQVLEEARPRVDVGVPLLEVAEFVEEAIRSKGGQPFPSIYPLIAAQLIIPPPQRMRAYLPRIW